MSLRLFAALPIPDDVAERLVALQRGVGGAHWAPRDNLHLTLRFFGDIQEPAAEELDAALEAAARGAPVFDVQLKGAGFFGGAEPHSLHIAAAENTALRALAAACERAARRSGLKPETRKYIPHVTLAYLNHVELRRVTAFEQRYALFESWPWRVEEFGLYSSQIRKNAPSLYRLEASYPLGM